MSCGFEADGITFGKLPTNPVIHAQHIDGIADIADFRDPKVFGIPRKLLRHVKSVKTLMTEEQIPPICIK